MSETFEPLPSPSQDMKKNEIISDVSVTSDNETLNESELTHETPVYCSSKSDNQKQDALFKGTIPKPTISRKREASNILLESVKRRDNLRTYNLERNVPLPQTNQKTPLRTMKCCNFPLVYKDNIEVQSVGPMNTSNSDLSDSASVTDSGIDTLSKSSSPCHSIDALSSQEDVGEECPAANMDVDTYDHLHNMTQEIQNFTECNKSGQSHVAIYKDLHCLHLTDEAVLPQNDDCVPKSPISKSLFKNVSSTIYFSLKDEKVAPMPDNVLPFMKWKLSTITPVLIKELLKKCGFTLLDANTNEEWLGTWGKHLKCASFKRIKNYQKVNHYPGSFHLGRKDKLWDNYKRMQSRYGVDAYDFFPETFNLPNDVNLLKSAWQTEDDKCFIVKPPAAARGTGVKVIYKWSQIPRVRPLVVQRYLSDPYLINGTKFDLRIYVLISSIEPLRVYVFEDGLVRFASEKYSLSNKSFANRYVHLTNYSVNKKSSSYTANEDENSCQGHKWTLKTFWTYMANSGINIEAIQESITDMIIKTVICTEGPICRLMKTYAKSTYNCYELFGFDVMLDKNLRPWLLEVNISPSLHNRSLLDYTVKAQMVKDMLNMIGFQVPERKCAYNAVKPPDYGVLSSVANKHKALRNRCLSSVEKEKHSVYTFQYEKFDILDELTPDDIRCLIESEDEFNRKGSFTRIFPSETSSKYFVYFEHIRYYNLLLDAWERNYYTRREEGIRLLQDLCEKKIHLHAQIKEPSEVEEPEIEITVH